MKEIDPIFAESQNILKKQFIEINDLSTTEVNQYETKPQALIACVINKKNNLRSHFCIYAFPRQIKLKGTQENYLEQFLKNGMLDLIFT